MPSSMYRWFSEPDVNINRDDGQGHLYSDFGKFWPSQHDSKRKHLTSILSHVLSFIYYFDIAIVTRTNKSEASECCLLFFEAYLLVYRPGLGNYHDEPCIDFVWNSVWVSVTMFYRQTEKKTAVKSRHFIYYSWWIPQPLLATETGN